MIAVLFPYLIWLDLSAGISFLDLATIAGNLRTGAGSSSALLVEPCRHGDPDRARARHVRSARAARRRRSSARRSHPAARGFVYFFALAPIVAMGLFALFTRRPENFMAAPLVVMSGLAVIVAAGDRIRIEHQYLIGYAWARAAGAAAAARGARDRDPALDRRGRSAGRAAGRRDGAVLRRQLSRAAPAGRSRSWPATRRWRRWWRSARRAGRASISNAAPERPPRVTRQDIADKGAVIVWPATDTPAGRRPRSRGSFPIWWPRCRARSRGNSRAACR